MKYQFGNFYTTINFTSSEELKKNILSKKAGKELLVFDKNTKGVFTRLVGGREVALEEVIFPSGEKEKNMENVKRLLEKALWLEMGRDDTITGVGGGVICDMSAFAASLYMRGCRLVLIPTTLLAMIDAAIGGKTGVNFGGYKNIIGTFYPAEEIRICVEFLSTLPESEFKNGLAELIKHALLGNGELLSIIEERRDEILKRNMLLLKEIVFQAVQVKCKIVERDLRESGERVSLNLGHTFAHALEAVSGLNTWPHGVAVAWGIGKALKAGEQIGVTDSEYAKRVKALLSGYGFELDLPELQEEKIIEAMKYDKKKRDGNVRLVLQRRLGETFITTVEEKVLLKVLED